MQNVVHFTVDQLALLMTPRSLPVKFSNLESQYIALEKSVTEKISCHSMSNIIQNLENCIKNFKFLFVFVVRRNELLENGRKYEFSACYIQGDPK